MGSVARSVLLTFMVLFMNVLHAETSKTINFENQREEIFDLENWLKETRYKAETIDTTCYRQEPYIENVCRDVTRYRKECSTIPGHQSCRTVYDQVCRTEYKYENECHYQQGPEQCRVVVRYRQECSTQGGGQQCHTIPGDVVCRVVNGENKCEKIPPRQVCENRPGQQVCRQVPYEERECSPGSSQQVCNQVNRPYQVCDSRPREQCDWEPARDVCSQVPYSVNECKDETLYNQIPYACKKDVQTPYEVTLKTHQANVQVLFDAKSTEAASRFSVALNNKGELNISGQELSGNKSVAFMKKNIKTAAVGDLNSIKAVYNIALINKEDLFSVESRGISDVELKKRSMTFVVNGKYDHARSSLAIKINKKDEVKFEKTLKASQFKSKFDGSVTRVTVDLEAVGAPKLGGLFNRKHTVTLKLKIDSGDMGEILLPKVGELSTGTSVEVEID